MGIIKAIYLLIRAFLMSRLSRAVENLALRQQVAVYQYTVNRPKLLIRRMSRENPLWGAPRILSELFLLGYHAAERIVAKYMVRTRRPPSQTW